MCGIAGLFRGHGPVTADDERTVRRMTDRQASRGPDGAQVWRGGRAVLGHRRLSIIDLSDSAAQPMPNEDGTVRLTYNGEVYNFAALRADLEALGHRFRSRGDSEVLVHGYEAWGIEGLLARLRGMFAFALHDAARGRLVLARDRLGIKPLYYAATDRGLAFASEVRALVAAGVAPGDDDPEAVAGFLLLGAVPEPRTVVRGVRCLPPGHYLIAGADGPRLVRYWALPAGPVPGEAGEEPARLVEELGADLRDAVARHLVSDVPLGVFLSGGVDSAGLVALARRRDGPRLHTLTVVFEEREFSEAEAARRVAEAYGTEHHQLLVTEADFRHELPAFLDAVDQPTNDGINTYFIAKAARKAGLTVALSGAGADEVFWGYAHHRRLVGPWAPLGRLAALAGPLRRAAVAGAALAGRVSGREGWRRLAYLGTRASADRLYLAVRGFFAPDQVARLTGLTGSELGRLLEEMVPPGPAGVDAGRARGVNRLELRRYLHDQLLRDTDVFGLAHSLEIRVPYLDHVVVERLAQVPERLLVGGALHKPLLVAAVAEPTVTARARDPKRGFTFPLDGWMRRQAAPLEALALRSGLEPAAVRAAWRAFRARRLHWSRAWALVVLGGRGRGTPGAGA